MLSCAAPRNCRSVAEQVWFTAALPFPPGRRTRNPVTKIATASPAAAVMRGFTPPLSARPEVSLHHPFGWVGPYVAMRTRRVAGRPSGRSRGARRGRRRTSEEQRAVVPMALHPDGLVDVDRGGVLRPHEEADGRHPLEQEP